MAKESEFFSQPSFSWCFLSISMRFKIQMEWALSLWMVIRLPRPVSLSFLSPSFPPVQQCKRWRKQGCLFLPRVQAESLRSSRKDLWQSLFGKQGLMCFQFIKYKIFKSTDLRHGTGYCWVPRAVFFFPSLIILLFSFFPIKNKTQIKCKWDALGWRR